MHRLINGALAECDLLRHVNFKLTLFYLNERSFKLDVLCRVVPVRVVVVTV